MLFTHFLLLSLFSNDIRKQTTNLNSFFSIEVMRNYIKQHDLNLVIKAVERFVIECWATGNKGRIFFMPSNYIDENFLVKL